MKFLKCRAKEMRKSKADLQTKFKLLKSSLDNDVFVFQYNQCKKQLEKIFENMSQGKSVRSRCQFFFNQEKLRGLQGKVRKIIVNNKEITSNSKIRKELRNYYKALFKNYNSKSFSDHEEFLDKIDIPKIYICDKDLVIRIYLNLNFIWPFQVWKITNLLITMVSLKNFMFLNGMKLKSFSLILPVKL